MKYSKLFIALCALTLFCSCKNGQNKITIKIDDTYSLALPASMEKNNTLNKDATLQYQNLNKELYAIVISEKKKDIHEAILSNNLNSKYNSDLKGYAHLLSNEFQSNAAITDSSKTEHTDINQLKAIKKTLSGKVNNIDIYWKIAYVEGKNNYYQILTWTSKSQEWANDREMENILNSFKELDRSK